MKDSCCATARIHRRSRRVPVIVIPNSSRRIDDELVHVRDHVLGVDRRADLGQRPGPERHDPVGARLLDDQGADERGVGIVRQALVVRGEVRDRGRLALHPEAAERAPLVLAHPPRVAGLPRERVRERADLVGALAQRQRVEEALAQAGVGEPRLAVDPDEQRHVVGRALAPHDGLVLGDLEARAAQQKRQDRVQLEAVAAAAVGQQPRAEQRLVQRPGLPQLDREVLVGHGGQVGAVERVQAVDVRRRCRGEPEPGEEGIEHARPILGVMARLIMGRLEEQRGGGQQRAEQAAEPRPGLDTADVRLDGVRIAEECVHASRNAQIPDCLRFAC